jgi:hypothetical protein
MENNNNSNDNSDLFISPDLQPDYNKPQYAPMQTTAFSPFDVGIPGTPGSDISNHSGGGQGGHTW